MCLTYNCMVISLASLPQKIWCHNCRPKHQEELIQWCFFISAHCTSTKFNQYQTRFKLNCQPLQYLYAGSPTLIRSIISSRKFSKKFREKSNFLFGLADSSDFSEQMQEEVFRKSSQTACSCCHCQKQSALLGLHSAEGAEEQENIPANFLPVG